jgi:hypothetical protein
MPAHKHAALMLQYAQDAQETDEPYLKWEARWNDVSGGTILSWKTCGDHPCWSVNKIYRRKQKTMIIAGKEIPIPLKEIPKSGKIYLAGSAYLHEMDVNSYDDFGSIDRQTVDRMLKAGIVHSTQEAALAHANALAKVTRDAIEEAK